MSRMPRVFLPSGPILTCTVAVSSMPASDELAKAVVTEQHPAVTVVLGMTVEAPNLVSFSAHSAV